MIFDLDKINMKKQEKGFIFTDKGNNYYFKIVKKKENIYNELIGCYLLKQLQIPCCSYYYGKYKETEGMVSKMFDTNTYQSMFDILKKVYPNISLNSHNNLENIEYTFNQLYNKETKERLMKELIDIFLYDVLIGNPDRHSKNYGIWEQNKKVEFAPLFDQENMLSNLSIEYGFYSIGIEEDDFLYNFYYLSPYSQNLLEKFLKIGSKKYLDRLDEMLPVIEKENIKECIKELSNEIKIENDRKERLIKRFEQNQRNIEKICNKVYQKRIV
ncbi:MAG: HipA domain-containing protein [Bacilli bacterium]|nr:HipA domain-containing protein [Bacilli bacterium]